MTRDADEGLVAAHLGLPEATGSRRMDWAAMPREVTARIGQLLGSPVADATSQRGGFSEGLAARVRLENGKRAFIKAAGSLMAPAVADFHRREIAVSERLPREVPAPRLLDAYDDGTHGPCLRRRLAPHAWIGLRTAAAAGTAADPNIVAMMNALGLASLRWLRSAQL